ncbi:MAG: YiiD C-terminal domain-containing protein [Pseudomonadota bacterium]
MSENKNVIYEMMKTFFEQNVPYAKHTGIELLEIADGHGAAKLPDRQETTNHMGTQHAGALFTLAEAASGAASVFLFADKVTTVKAAIVEANIAYLRSARGDIMAHGKLRRPGTEILDTFNSEGKVDYMVDVVLSDSKGREVCTMDVKWSIKSIV